MYIYLPNNLCEYKGTTRSNSLDLLYCVSIVFVLTVTLEPNIMVSGCFPWSLGICLLTKMLTPSFTTILYPMFYSDLVQHGPSFTSIFNRDINVPI